MKGVLPIDNILSLIHLVEGVKGKFIELGVHKGSSLIPLAWIGKQQGRPCYAVDSFSGMGPPTEGDGAIGAEHYPAGKFDVGGTGMLKNRLAAARLSGYVNIYEGYVPEVLGSVGRGPFAFAHLDLDHYAPTLDALKWVWPQIAPGGILACHDYAAKIEVMASKAVKEFAFGIGAKPHARERTAWFRKE